MLIGFVIFQSRSKDFSIATKSAGVLISSLFIPYVPIASNLTTFLSLKSFGFLLRSTRIGSLRKKIVGSSVRLTETLLSKEWPNITDWLAPFSLIVIVYRGLSRPYLANSAVSGRKSALSICRSLSLPIISLIFSRSARSLMGSTSLQKMPFLLQTTLNSFVFICRLSTASLSKVNTHLLLKSRTFLTTLSWRVPGTTTTSSLVSSLMYTLSPAASFWPTNTVYLSLGPVTCILSPLAGIFVNMVIEVLGTSSP